MTAHVRWPARLAELRAGLDFFGSFCIKTKRTGRLFKLNFPYFLLLVQKKVPKKSTAPMIYGHWRRPD
jgi:hypothetical protein